MDTTIEVSSAGPGREPALYLHQGDRVIAMTWTDWQELITEAGYRYSRWRLLEAEKVGALDGGLSPGWTDADSERDAFRDKQ